jgi:hypothetical protein
MPSSEETGGWNNYSQGPSTASWMRNDIQADLESQLHEKLLKKVFHEDQRVRCSTRQPQWQVRKELQGVDFRKGLKASEE